MACINLDPKCKQPFQPVCHSAFPSTLAVLRRTSYHMKVAFQLTISCGVSLQIQPPRLNKDDFQLG
jgi:hypothetical protein